MGAGLSELDALVLVVTAACNLRCQYCYQNRKRPRHLAWRTARRAIDVLIEAGAVNAQLRFVGGEPLLGFPLIRRIVVELERRLPASRAVRYEIITNGVLVAPRHVRFFDAHRFDVDVSFDGISPAQRLRGPGTLERLDRRLGTWRTGFPRFFEDSLSITMTVVPPTVTYLADGVEYFLARGVQRIELVPAFTGYSAWRVADLHQLESAFARIVEASDRHYRQSGQVPVSLFRKTRPDRTVHVQTLPMCSVRSGRVLTVDVDGRVYGCAVGARSYQVFTTPLSQDGLGSLAIGHVDDADLAHRVREFRTRLRSVAIFNDKANKFSSYGRCGECPYLSRCSICPAGIAHLSGNTDPNRVPDFPCAFTRVALACRDRFPVQAAAGPGSDAGPVPET